MSISSKRSCIHDEIQDLDLDLDGTFKLPYLTAPEAKIYYVEMKLEMAAILDSNMAASLV